jgi:hypothetical protein
MSEKPVNYLMPVWVAAISLAVLALVGIVWTVELVRLQTEMERVARAISDYLSQLGSSFGGGTDCPAGQTGC